MRSPKLTTERSSDWYRYYAGYSRNFVEDALDALELENGATVLDPWNGSGTTTSVANERGHTPVGFDANPALVIVARARLLGSEVIESLEPLAQDISEHARAMSRDEVLEEEPLEKWFRASSARSIRHVEWAIQHVLIDHGRRTPLSDDGVLDQVSALAAFFYVALFETARTELKSFVGSNPTWVRMPSEEERLWVDPRTLRKRFVLAVNRLAKKVGDHVATSGFDPINCVRQANSTSLPVDDQSIQAAVTSPPYCTRIDYIVATRPELAILGFKESDLRLLRQGMVGTPTIEKETPTRLDQWGCTATTFLASVEAHSSHASASYYRKYFTQYVDALWRSLRELKRVLTPDGQTIVVVQDSYYKELHIDLARIVREMAEGLGWQRVDQTDFAIAKTKAAINPGARSWRGDFSATESALLLR
jgi:SAM-dependent methyltransferase